MLEQVLRQRRKAGMGPCRSSSRGLRAVSKLKINSDELMRPEADISGVGSLFDARLQARFWDENS